MTITPPRIAQRGFTLIELLIVVIILAILAAIVIPQFANSTTDAREGALDANLSTMRSAIEMYKAQHKNNYPAAVLVTSGGGTCGGTKGASTAANQVFIDQLTLPTDANGNTCTVADNVYYSYGPYLRGAIPVEPIYSKGSLAADIAVTALGTKLDPAAAVVTGGWAFDSKSGQLILNSGAADSKGNKYSSH